MKLVLVESPAKIKSLSRYLGAPYTVMATYGHVRDLPSKTGSVDPEKDFHMTFERIDKNKKHLLEIERAAAKADKLILATDPDREGEAISWHVVEHLKSKKKLPALERITFNSITKKAVLDALKTPRKIDANLVDAYLARLSLDYLVGFTLSPVLWRKLPGCRSAGRVQSVALRLLCERESAIEAFKPQEYWTIKGAFKTGKHTFDSTLYSLDGKKLEKFSLPSEKDAKAAQKKADATPYTLAKVEKKRVSRHPAAPFMTSTLQQEASRKLGFSAVQTMRAAQKLYEGVEGVLDGSGLITYMRTDSTTMADEAIQGARKAIQTLYGKDHVADKVRVYSRKARNAQEAHEAIRPTSFETTPKELLGKIDSDLQKVYELVWRRAMASQMASALFDQVTFTLEHPQKQATFRVSGRTCVFKGFLEAYLEGKDAEDKDEQEDSNALPALEEGTKLDLKKLTPHQHFTEPPPRYSEASLIKKMEEAGIGRPSTYARILQVLKERSYVLLHKKQLIPKEKGRVVSSFLVHFFNRYVEESFTATLEESLDAISRGDTAWKKVLQDFWKPFKEETDRVFEVKTVDVLKAVEEDLKAHLFKNETNTCPTCKKGELHLRIGKFGPFLGCNRYPDCNHMLSLEKADPDQKDDSPEEASLQLPKVLGEDPNLGETISVRRGPYGFYLQWGEGKKPKRISLSKLFSPATITLKEAIKLGRLPIKLGAHPETGEEMIGNIGRFGPYVHHMGKFTSIKDINLLLEEKIHDIVEIMQQKKQRRPKKK